MKRLIEIAEKIKNKDLREKTVRLLKEPEISNPEIIYPKSDFAKAPVWIGAHHNYEGGLIDHTLSVARTAIDMAKNFENAYNISVNHDHLIAGALLHDIMKIFILTKMGKNWSFTGSVLDHAQFTACELYARGFPEEVIHIVASHGGDMGTAGANPRTLEALIVFYADIFDSAVESFVHGTPKIVLVQQEKEEE